jgi:NIMA (never in mitosis gene a)-related kinase
MLADFGVSKIIEAKTICLEAHTQAETLNYMSPEMTHKKLYSYKTDIWSLGCVVFEMMTLCHSFEAENQVELITAIILKEIKEKNSTHSDELKRVILQMLIKSGDLGLNFEMFEKI